MKMKLSPTMSSDELDRLLNDTGESAVRTGESAVRTGRYDRLHNEFPERIEVRLKAGTKKVLQTKAQELGFNSIGKLVRIALKEYLEKN